MQQNSILFGRGVKQVTILTQIIVTFLITTANLTVKTNRPDIILKNTTVPYEQKETQIPTLHWM